MKRLTQPNKYIYAGISKEQASKKALEVCNIASETGQTILAKEHLDFLCPIISQGDI